MIDLLLQIALPLEQLDSSASSGIGSANLSLISSYSLSRFTIGLQPSSTTSSTVLSGSSFGSCSRNPSDVAGRSA